MLWTPPQLVRPWSFERSTEGKAKTAEVEAETTGFGTPDCLPTPALHQPAANNCGYSSRHE